MDRFLMQIGQIFSKTAIPRVGFVDVVEILLLSFFVYQVTVWIKYTRAYTLLKGTLLVLAFIFLAYIFKLNTILWIIKNMTTILITAVLVIFQPELRKALEQLGKKKIMLSLFPFDTGKEVEERFTDRTVNEITRAAFEMSEVKTGALIVIEKEDNLADIEKTGIALDALVSSQLLINIFEHNTPLHDGAVTIRGNRITAATCYLDLSSSPALSKDLGTRHRAGVGVSEKYDSLTIIVSEETGHVSLAQDGKLIRNVTHAQLRKALVTLQNKTEIEKPKKLYYFWKGWKKHEERPDENPDE